MNKVKLLQPLLFLVCLLGATVVLAQGKTTVTISGKVAEKGEPLVGASVLLEGTTNGSVTDLDGNYSFQFTGTEGATVNIVANFVGYAVAKKAITVKNGTQTIDFEMSADRLNLDEVVIVGSSVKQQRSQLGNALNSVTADQIAKSGTGNAIQALQGKVAGAQISQNSGDPAGGITVRLRGAKSLLGSSEPLYVIDGVISNNGTVNVTNANVDAGATSGIGQNRLADLNPNDIESVNVINGAAAAAIYGSRASNGVVVITTKRGKSGKPQISFSTSYAFNELRKKSFVSTFGKQFHPNSNTTDPNAAGYLNPTLATLWPVAKGGSIAPADSITVWPSMIDVTRYDYQDYVFRKSNGTDNNLSISGGNDKTRYFGSLSFFNNEGIIKNTDFRRMSGRVRLDQEITSWLSASVGLMYANSFSNELPNGNVFFSPTNAINITNNIFKIDDRDAAGNLKAVENLGRVNPLSIIEEIKNSQETNRMVGDLQFTARPIEGMSISYILGIDNTNQLGRNFSPTYPYNVNPAYFNKGYAANNSAFTTLINNDLNVSYEKGFGDFSLNAVTGFNYQFSREQISFTQGRDLAPFVTTVNGATVVLPPTFADVRSAIAGGFLQGTFGYGNRYFLTLAGRYDAASRYPEESRTNFYPKVGFSYVLSREDFWKGLKDIAPSVKIRASWGQAGNLTGFGVFDRFNRFSTSSFNGVTAINASSAIADPSVKVERNEELEFGTDLTLFNDRVNIGFTWYKQTANDLLLNVTTAPTQGGSSIKTNVGTLENKGIELTLGFTPIKTRDMSLNIFGTYSHNENLVTKLPAGLTAISNPTGAPVFVMQGAPVGVFYGTFYARDDAGNILNRPIKVNTVPTQLPQVERGPAQNPLTPLSYTTFRGANGQPVLTGANSNALRKIIGNPNPRNIWSTGFEFKYKKLAINGLLDAVSGVEIFNADKRTRNNVGIGEMSEKELKGEVPRGTVAALAGIEEFRIDDGSFVKLRELSLSYDLGSMIKGMTGLQLAVSGRNLYSWDNYFGFDPETSAGGQSSVLRGVDFGNFPIPRTYQVSLRANF
jgi:TonB-linked SusC/RagA family outer membrane protein